MTRTPLRSLLGQLPRDLLALLYPPLCASCDAPCRAPGLCAVCAQSLLPVGPACPHCALPLENAPHLAVPQEPPRASGACRICRGRFPWRSAASTWQWGGALAVAMRRLKLGGRPDLARPLAESLVPLLSGCRPDALVVPVPLHRRRLIERGFNQAALLSLVAARQTGHQVALRALDRSRETPSQATLSLPERHRSPRGAFVAVSRFVTAREVILVDDVLTTGATAAAATEALLRAGARDVRVLTVARAVP